MAGETPSLDKIVAEMYENAHKDLDKHEALLRVARMLKVVKDLDEAGYRHHGTSFLSALELAFEALKEVEYLL